MIALVVLVPIILLFAGLARACSFSPGGPSIDTGGLPTVDAPAELASAAPRMPFDVRVPAVPDGWRANSVGTAPIAGVAAVRVGWLTSQDRFLRVVQSAATEGDLVLAQLGTSAVAGGPVEVAGRRWVVYTPGSVAGAGGASAVREPAWVTAFAAADASHPPTRVLITGGGTADDFRAMAAAVSSGQVLPSG